MTFRYELSFGELGEWFVFYGGLCVGGKGTNWLKCDGFPIVIWVNWVSVYKWLVP